MLGVPKVLNSNSLDSSRHFRVVGVDIRAKIYRVIHVFFISIPPLSIVGYLFGVKVKHIFRLTFQKVKHSRVHLFAGGGRGLPKNKVPHNSICYISLC